MTLPSINTTTTLPGNGSAILFDFSFKVWEPTDLEVWITNEDNVVTKMTSNWSVMLNSNQDANPGGTVRYPVSGDPLTEDEAITIKRGMSFTQLTKFSRGQGFDPVVVGIALDRIKAELQELLETIQRSIRVPVSMGSVDTGLPAPAANNFLAWNAEATALINAAGMVSVPVSTIMATLLDDENIAAALTTLGFSAFIQSLISTADENDLLSLFDNPSSGSISKLNWLQGLISKQAGLTWRNYDSANSSNEYRSVAWSPELGLLAAVSQTGTNTIQTSPDGRNWTEQIAPQRTWTGIIWAPGVGGGSGLFVVVGRSAADNQLVMTSPDGLSWTLHTVPGDNNWGDVAWSPDLSLFVATAYSGNSTNQFVMTSSDGINWDLQNSPEGGWSEVIWVHELSLFIALSNNGSPAGQAIMTSSDGVDWTPRNTPADNGWSGLAWSPELELLVAVRYNGTGDRIMTSSDGINWDLRNSPADNSWGSIDWSPELGIFAATAFSGADPRIMTSPDGSWS